MTPPLSEAQRMELLARVDALAALIKSYAPDDAYLAGEAKPLAHFIIRHWAKSQLSRLPEAALSEQCHEALNKLCGFAKPGCTLDVIAAATDLANLLVREAIASKEPESQGVSIPEVSIEEMREKA